MAKKIFRCFGASLTYSERKAKKKKKKKKNLKKMNFVSDGQFREGGLNFKCWWHISLPKQAQSQCY